MLLNLPNFGGDVSSHNDGIQDSVELEEWTEFLATLVSRTGVPAVYPWYCKDHRQERLGGQKGLGICKLGGVWLRMLGQQMYSGRE